MRRAGNRRQNSVRNGTRLVHDRAKKLSAHPTNMSRVAKSGFGYAGKCMLRWFKSPPRCRHRDRTRNITWQNGNAISRTSLPTTSTSCTACQQSKPVKKHTCWRRETRAAKQTDTRRKRTVQSRRVKYWGHQYKTQMVALIGLRGLQRGDNFELSCNRDGAGNFDDLVYTAGGRRYFLQLKHADSTDKKKLTKTSRDTTAKIFQIIL